MVDVPAAKLAKIQWRGRILHGPTWTQTVYVNTDGGPDIATIVAQVDAAWDAHAEQTVSDSVTIDSRLVTNVVPPIVHVDIPFTPRAGLLAGDPCPSSDCVVVSLKTSHGGRTGRGRIYVSPLPKSWLAYNDGEGTVWQPTHSDGVATQWLTFFTTLTAYASVNGGAAAPCVYSRKDAGGWLITSAVGHTYIGSQRRRDHLHH